MTHFKHLVCISSPSRCQGWIGFGVAGATLLLAVVTTNAAPRIGSHDPEFAIMQDPSREPHQADPFSSRPDLHPDLELSIRLLDETWCILDDLSQVIWPGWDTHKLEAAYFGIPGVQDVLINFPDQTPPDFVPLDIEVHGTQVLLRSTNARKRVHGGSHLNLDRKGYSLVSLPAPLEADIDRQMTTFARFFDNSIQPPYLYELVLSLEYFMSTIAHESFHLYQERMREERGMDRKETDFLDPDQAALSSLEGVILNQALAGPDEARTIELCRQFLAVRRHRRASLTPANLNWEGQREWMEGSAMYVQLKLLLMLDEIDYEPRRLDPEQERFHGFALTPNVERFMSDALLGATRSIEDGTSRWYHLGMAQAFALDRLAGDTWKAALLEDGATFDGLIAAQVGFEEAMVDGYLEKARSEHGYETIRADAVRRIDERSTRLGIDQMLYAPGKKYRIDMATQVKRDKDAGRLHYVNTPRLPRTRIRVPGGSVMVDGYEEFAFASGTLRTETIPLFMPDGSRFYYEWLDTENPNHEVDYALTFKKREGDVYWNVELKTRGFTYTAEKAEIVDRGEEVDIATLK